MTAIEARNETHLTYAQEKHLKSLGCHLKTIQNMLRAIKREKENTSDEDRKQYLTNLLNNIKNGEITGPVKIGGRLYNPLFTEVREESFVSSNAKYLSAGIQTKDSSSVVVDCEGVSENIYDRPPPFAPSYERRNDEVTASFIPR